MTKSRGVNRPKFVWDPEVERLFALLYPVEPTQRLADIIGASLSTAYSKATRLGLKKSDEFLRGEMSGRIQQGRSDPRMIATQFKKGGASWNKGNKGWQAGGRSKETQFKKSHEPHNQLPIGSHRVVKSKSGWQTLERKVSDVPGPNNLRWKPVTRLLWEEMNGPVPSGHIVAFKPGMATVKLEEITIDRLECISQADNARRNAPSARYPEGLYKVIQLKGALQRQINKRAKKNEQIDK